MRGRCPKCQGSFEFTTAGSIACPHCGATMTLRAKSTGAVVAPGSLVDAAPEEGGGFEPAAESGVLIIEGMPPPRRPKPPAPEEEATAPAPPAEEGGTKRRARGEPEAATHPCQECRAPILLTAKRCRHCGAPQGDAPAPPPAEKPHAPERDRRPAPGAPVTAGTSPRGAPIRAPGRETGHALGTGYDYTGGKGEEPKRDLHADLEPQDYIFAALCGPVACITSLIWIAQGKKKGPKMIAVCFVFGLLERFLLKVFLPRIVFPDLF